MIRSNRALPPALPPGRLGLKPVCGAAAGVLLFAAPFEASAYPIWDDVMELTQPDGTRVRVVLSGDEFYMRARAFGADAVEREGAARTSSAPRVVLDVGRPDAR